MEEAENYPAWREAALRRDSALGLDAWRAREETRRYDWQAVRDRVDTLRRLRDSDDAAGLMNSLNEGIHGNISGIGGNSLYSKATFGTKDLIVEYVELVAECMDYLATRPRDVLSDAVKLEFFERAQTCFGTSALMLSGSGTLFFFHLGVARALMKESLLPRVISGSSGGAVVSAVIGTRSWSEALEALHPDTFHHFVRRRGEKKDLTLRNFAAKYRQRMVSELIPNDLTFLEAQELSGLRINVSVAPADIHQTSRLLNAITSPTVFIRDAVLASTSLPGALEPVTLKSRGANGERQPFLPRLSWVDGSLSDDLPARRLARLYGVNHFIVSQVNPHVVPFVTDAKSNHDLFSVLRRTTQRTLRELITGTIGLIHRPLTTNSKLAYRLNSVMSVLNQDYLGNVNIMPPLRLTNPMRLLSYRTDDEALELMRVGERSTWPKLEMVRIQTLIGRTLDRILDRCRSSWLASN